jgi:hypothetical protein
MRLIILILIGICYGLIGSMLEHYNLITQPVWWAMYGFIWGVVYMLIHELMEDRLC